MEKGGSRYYVATDQVETPRVVSDSTGTTVKATEYDSDGNLTSDTNPGFELPLGFAGGLADPDTGLVRFGWRDYDPAEGRWTALDPILFAAGEPNLYAYVGNNPVVRRDPQGLFAYDAGICAGVCVNARLAITSEGTRIPRGPVRPPVRDRRRAQLRRQSRPVVQEVRED